jgi:hypothetical protein
MNETRAMEPGDVVEIVGVAPLPYGLGDGLQVRLVRLMDREWRLVERDGHEWVVGAGQLRSRLRPGPASPCGSPAAGTRAVRPRESARRAFMPATTWR